MPIPGNEYKSNSAKVMVANRRKRPAGLGHSTTAAQNQKKAKCASDDQLQPQRDVGGTNESDEAMQVGNSQDGIEQPNDANPDTATVSFEDTADITDEISEVKAITKLALARLGLSSEKNYVPFSLYLLIFLLIFLSIKESAIGHPVAAWHCA